MLDGVFFCMFHRVVPGIQWDKIVRDQWETFESLAESRYISRRRPSSQWGGTLDPRSPRRDASHGLAGVRYRSGGIHFPSNPLAWMEG